MNTEIKYQKYEKSKYIYWFVTKCFQWMFYCVLDTKRPPYLFLSIHRVPDILDIPAFWGQGEGSLLQALLRPFLFPTVALPPGLPAPALQGGMEARLQGDGGADQALCPQSLLTAPAPPALTAEQAGESEEQEEQTEDDQNQEQDNLEIFLALTERVQKVLERADRSRGRFAFTLLNRKKVPELR